MQEAHSLLGPECEKEDVMKKRTTTRRRKPELEPISPRQHGDSYSDAIRDDGDVDAATHVKRTDRRFEEPSEQAAGAGDAHDPFGS